MDPGMEKMRGANSAMWKASGGDGFPFFRVRSVIRGGMASNMMMFEAKPQKRAPVVVVGRF